jgi:hypothetical protein
MDDVTSHQIVVRSSRIRQILHVGASGLGRPPEIQKRKRCEMMSKLGQKMCELWRESITLPFGLLLELSLSVDEASSLALSLDSRYPESSDEF